MNHRVKIDCSPSISNDAPLVRLRACDVPFAELPSAIAMAVIIGVDGPSYRPVGATMFVGDGGVMAGNLSSGCIDADVALHAIQVAASGVGKVVRYGAGSPYIDLRLPCGGGLVILIMPVNDDRSLREFAMAMHDRRVFTFGLTLNGPVSSETPDVMMRLAVSPDPRFLVFGKGPEAGAFVRMVSAAGYDTRAYGNDTTPMGPTALAMCANADPHTAVVLFFHDHDYEPEILRAALAGQAFYIGAQGSRSTAARRLATLRKMGIGDDDCVRVRGPIGMIPSTRDPRTLAISVLAEVLAEVVG